MVVKALANEDTLLGTHCCLGVQTHGTQNECCVSAAQSGKHLLRTQNVSEQNQKHFLCPGHKICVCNKCCAHGQTGKHLCWQQCVRKRSPRLPGPLGCTIKVSLNLVLLIFFNSQFAITTVMTSVRGWYGLVLLCLYSYCSLN